MSVLMRTYSLKPSIIVHKIMYMYKKKSRHFENLSVLSLLRFKKKKILIHYVEAGYIVYYI